MLPCDVTGQKTVGDQFPVRRAAAWEVCLSWNVKNVRWNLKSLYFPGTHLFWLLISSHQSISKPALEEEEQEEEKPIWEPEMELQVLN